MRSNLSVLPPSFQIPSSQVFNKSNDHCNSTLIDADLDTEINNNENIQIDFSMMETQTSQRSSKSLQSWSLSYEKILLLWNQSNSPWNFAVRLMMEIFPLHELMGDVNVNGCYLDQLLLL